MNYSYLMERHKGARLPINRLGCGSSIRIKSLFSGAAVTIFLALIASGSLAVADSESASPDMGRIRAFLLKGEKDLVGVLITARETRVTFREKEALEESLNSNTHLDPRIVAQVKASLQDQPTVVTNNFTHSYRFGSESALTTTVESDGTGHPKIENRILATSEHILEKRIPLQAAHDAKLITPDGMIQPRHHRLTGGWPVFLARKTLGDLLKDSPDATCATGTLPSGERSFIVRIPVHSGAIGSFELVLAGDDFKPVELTSYLTNRTLLGRISLDFSNDTKLYGVCQGATTEQFENGRLYQRSVWHLESVETNASPPTEKADSFFGPFSAVNDMRFSRPLAYHVSGRLPNSLEIDRMLTNRNGTARFEAATLRPDLPPTSGTARKHQPARRWVVAIVLVLLVVPFVVLYRLMQSRNESR